MKRSREKIVPRLQLFKPSPALSIDRSGNRRLGHQNSLRLLPARELQTPSLGSCQSCRTKVPSISSAPGGHVYDILHAAPYTVFARLQATRSCATARSRAQSKGNMNEVATVSVFIINQSPSTSSVATWLTNHKVATRPYQVAGRDCSSSTIGGNDPQPPNERPDSKARDHANQGILCSTAQSNRPYFVGESRGSSSILCQRRNSCRE